MNREELLRRLSATFIEELAEHVGVFNSELLLLEQNPPPARREQAIHALFRAAHSLKGAARAVSASGIESVAHRLEDLLSRIRDGRRQLTPDLFRVLFAAADGFEGAGRRFAAGSAVDAGLGSLVEELNRALLVPDSPSVAPVDEAPATPVGNQKLDLSLPGPVPAGAAAQAEVVVASSGSSADRSPEPNPAFAGSHTPSSSVRIGHARLDTLLRQSSELTITRRRFEARREELSAIQDTLGRLRAEWHAIGFSLRRFKRERPTEGDAARVGTEIPRRLERLFERMEEELGRFSRDVERVSAALREDTKALHRAASPLEAQIHQLRLLPFSQACEGLSRVVRDLSLAQQKQVDLKLVGADVELDRAIVEGLREPLLHLLRNAIDHGVEPAEVRARSNKPPRATLTIAAIASGDSVEVSVSDDGRGLDREGIRAKLRERGLGDESAESQLERAIFRPGFSTARQVTDVSGRGVGLDIVKTTVERMNGSVAVSGDDSGTRFALTLPLTLSTVRVLFVRVGSEVLALPSAAVAVLLGVAPRDLKYAADKVAISHRGTPIAAAALGAILGLAQDERLPDAPLYAVVLRAEGRRAALIVDELLTEQDVLLKSLGPRVQELPYVSSGTLLSSGEVALLLKPQALLMAALDLPTSSPLVPERAEGGARHRLLLADDSLTTRALERSILEAAGYEVIVAVDGQSAWQLLQERGADLLLSDVEMPRMDGLSLTQIVRTSKRFRDLPVILLTSRDSPDDRARGLEAGANAYLVKSAFDQTKLLQAIEQLL